MTRPDPQLPPQAADFEVFYAASKDRVLRAAVASTGDVHDAEDCTAEAFARAYPGSLTTYDADNSPDR